MDLKERKNCSHSITEALVVSKLVLQGLLQSILWNTNLELQESSNASEKNGNKLLHIKNLLNVNRLNFSMKGQRGAKWIRKQNPTLSFLQQTQLHSYDNHKFREKIGKQSYKLAVITASMYILKSILSTIQEKK